MGGKLFLAPISSPERVIDLATGTGIWAIDFGRLQLILRLNCSAADTKLLRSRQISNCGGELNNYFFLYVRLTT